MALAYHLLGGVTVYGGSFRVYGLLLTGMPLDGALELASIDLLLAWWDNGFGLPLAWRDVGLWYLALPALHSLGTNL